MVEVMRQCNARLDMLGKVGQDQKSRYRSGIAARIVAATSLDIVMDTDLAGLGCMVSMRTNQEGGPQKVLQFQAPCSDWAMLAMRGLSGRVGEAGVSMAVVLLPEESLLWRLRRRCSHSR